MRDNIRDWIEAFVRTIGFIGLIFLGTGSFILVAAFGTKFISDNLEAILPWAGVGLFIILIGYMFKWELEYVKKKRWEKFLKESDDKDDRIY